MIDSLLIHSNRMYEDDEGGRGGTGKGGGFVGWWWIQWVRGVEDEKKRVRDNK